jgi:hypothetical protein
MTTCLEKAGGQLRRRNASLGESSDMSGAIGAMLVERGLLSEDEVKQALIDQDQQDGKRLGEILVDQGKISRPLLERFVARQAGVVLEAEQGFGTGLRTMIERRHLERSGVSADVIEVNTRENAAVRRERRLANRRLRADRRKPSQC